MAPYVTDRTECALDHLLLFLFFFWFFGGYCPLTAELGTIPHMTGFTRYHMSRHDRMARTGDYDQPTWEFILALDDARRRFGTRHLSGSQIFQVVLSLGYRKPRRKNDLLLAAARRLQRARDRKNAAAQASPQEAAEPGQQAG